VLEGMTQPQSNRNAVQMCVMLKDTRNPKLNLTVVLTGLTLT